MALRLFKGLVLRVGPILGRPEGPCILDTGACITATNTLHTLWVRLDELVWNAQIKALSEMQVHGVKRQGGVLSSFTLPGMFNFTLQESQLSIESVIMPKHV